MKNKLLALALIVCMLSQFTVITVFAATETTYIDETVFSQNFEGGFSAASPDFSVEDDPSAPDVEPPATKNKVLKMTDAEDSTSRTYQTFTLTNPVPAGASYAVSFKILATPELAANSGTIWFVQVLNGSSEAISLKGEGSNLINVLAANDYRAHKLTVGNVVTPVGALGKGDGLINTELPVEALKTYSLSVDAVNNKVTIKLDDAVLADNKSYSELGLNETNLERGFPTFRLYCYPTSGKTVTGIYFDDFSVTYKKPVEYDPTSLTMDFNATMDYPSNKPTLKITNGAVNKYLNQTIKLDLVSESDSSTTALDSKLAEKVIENNVETGKFSFNKELPTTVAPGYYNVRISQWVDGVEKTYKATRLYIASEEQRTNLLGFFNGLKNLDITSTSDLDTAVSNLQTYLPCLLTDEEANSLFEKVNGAYTSQAINNMQFIIKYFKSIGRTYGDVADVTPEFTNAKKYLNLKNASTFNEVMTILKDNHFLDNYMKDEDGIVTSSITDEILLDNQEKFVSHFDRKRTDLANPLVSDADIADAVTYAYAFTALNAAERSGIQGIINSYNTDVFGLDISSDRVMALNQDDLYSALYHKDYTDITVISTDWNNRILELEEQDIQEDNTQEEVYYPVQSGGGGGGGRFTSTIPAVKPQVEPPKENEITKPLSFPDTAGHWAEEYISTLAAKNIVTGYPDGSYNPNGGVTRAESIALIMRIVPSESKSDIQFSDVSVQDWFYDELVQAVGANIVTGFDGKIMPNDFVTREQLAVMLYRAINPDTKGGDITFSDGDDISDYALDAFSYLISKNYFSGYGDNTLCPKTNITRGEIAKLLCMLLNELNQ